MKDDPRVIDFLENRRGWKIHRVALVEAACEWADRKCVFRISNGPRRAIMMNCLFHHEKTPSMFMYISGTVHCYGCGTHLSWLDLIIQLGQPQDVDELLRIGRKFIYSKSPEISTQLLLDLT